MQKDGGYKAEREINAAEPKSGADTQNPKAGGRKIMHGSANR